ncbi:MAG: GIY-YIG nuclease family protein [Salinibacter sp.]|uniref:GIY-YIG nuclease family protein n=1 Tax=Salinibacter sp. TaxID=2065818 RepID=UPI002FC3D099
MTDAPGTYALLLRAGEERIIEVGALGAMPVRPGTYIYVGSAFGPGGLRARVGRHARGDGALHWHVDYLRAVTALEAVWYTHDTERRECTWAAALRALSDGTVPVQGFGASDCNCPAHLARFASAPSFDTFQARLSERCPDHASVERVGTNDLL